VGAAGSPLDDASFNAGTNSGSSHEYQDTANRLHFYIIGKHTDSDGILHYTIGVQSFDGTGPQTRGVKLAAAPATQAPDTGEWSTCTFPLTNTGVAATTDPATNPSDATQYLNSDVYRLSAFATGTGWTAQLEDVLATAKFGDTTSVPVYVSRADGASQTGRVTLTATSVSDPSKTATAVCGVSGTDVGGTVPATLALSLGTPANFGPLHAGTRSRSGSSRRSPPPMRSGRAATRRR
jgi:hypothetical protein